ncbi:MAG: TolC family protein [Mariprofundus sp.]|nr:TolC family protein [Mariprofundus sp.]
MRTLFLTIGMLLCIQPILSHADSLQQAMETAVEQHPMLQMAEQQIAAAQGNLSEQSAYAYNPELSLEPQRRRLNGGGSSNDYYITLSQSIETAGKQGFREQSAQAVLNQMNQHKSNTRQQLMIAAANAYVALYFTEQALELRSQQSSMLKKVSHAVALQLKLGQSSQLDANLAQSAFSSALNATTVARQILTRSKQAYLTALGNVSSPLSSKHPLPKLQTSWQPPADAYAMALKSRPDLAALRAKLRQSEAQVDLANATRLPDITVSAMTGREAGENLIKLGFTMPIPVLNSHKGAYRAALAEQERVSTGLDWSTQQLRYAVQSAVDNHANAMLALSGIISSHMQQSAKNTISLAQKAYDAGELDLEELVVHIRQGLDARMTALEIIQQAWFARIRLAEVLGHPEYILKGIQS